MKELIKTRVVEHALRLTEQYAEEEMLATCRDTSDLSPLEKWLIFKHFQLTEEKARLETLYRVNNP